MARPTARSLILDLLSTVPRHTMPVGLLVEAAGLFGIEENNVRVSLARLYAAGSVERDERGRYRIGGAARIVQDQVREWRNPKEKLSAWTGTWVAVAGAALPRGRSKTALKIRAALGLLGFRPFEGGLELRPDNLQGGVPGVRRALVELGLEAGAPVFGVTDLDPAADLAARSLWDGEALAAGYRETRKILANSTAHLDALDPRDAMVESFLIGGEALRQLAHDPLLPAPLVDPAEREALARDLRAYEKRGQRCWADLLSRHEVAHRGHPVDLHQTPRGEAILPAPSRSSEVRH